MTEINEEITIVIENLITNVDVSYLTVDAKIEPVIYVSEVAPINFLVNISPDSYIIEVGIQGPSGPIGAPGANNHFNLINLSFENSGHTGFQKKLLFDADLKCLLN